MTQERKDIKLTPEQEAKIPEYVERWFKIGTCVEPAEKTAAEDAIRLAYRANGYAEPTEIEWATSPLDGAIKVAKRLHSTQKPTKEQIRSVFSTMSMGSFDAGWLAFYVFLREVCGIVDETNIISGHMELAKHSGPWFHYEGYACVSERPLVVGLDERYRLHSNNGPALAWGDGFRIYAVHGTEVEERLIEKPESISVSEIQKEQNAELRRMMIERYGPKVPKAARDAQYRGTGAYLLDSNATVIDSVPEDSKDHPYGCLGGRLLRMEIADDEPITMLQLRNSTPEDDGTYKTYFIEVPPDTKSVVQGVAWSFGFEQEAEYAPVIET